MFVIEQPITGYPSHYQTDMLLAYLLLRQRQMHIGMKRIHSIIVLLLGTVGGLSAQSNIDTVRLSLKEAIMLAQLQSVDAAVALNELKTAYWEYRTHRADQLPEMYFTGNIPSYNQKYNLRQNDDGTVGYMRNYSLGLSGDLAIEQNIALTGGKIALNTSLDFTRQLGEKANNNYMSIPIGLTLTQPIFGVNNQKWKRRIEPVRYKEAKAAYMESVEKVTLNTINYFFNLLLGQSNLNMAQQNLENADKLHEIAIAKRKIGHISETELMRLKQSALQARAKVTEAQSELNARMFQLRSFLGLSERDIIEPLIPEAAPNVRMDYQLILEKARENNSFAKNILRRQLEADYEVAIAKGNRRNINLFASIGYTGNENTFEGAYRDLKDNQIVEIGITIPLVDWGKRKGKVKVAESNREVILSRTRQEEMNFNQDIFLLVERFNNQAAQLEIATEVTDLAERRYHTSIETFLIGKIDILDLNDAQNSKDDARQKHITELYNFWYYYYNIRSLTLYDFLTNQTLDADFEEIVKR